MRIKRNGSVGIKRAPVAKCTVSIDERIYLKQTFLFLSTSLEYALLSRILFWLRSVWLEYPCYKSAANPGKIGK